MQSYVPVNKLQYALEKTAIEFVNKIGVDLISAVLHTHLQQQLWFLNGLGPRKSKRMAEIMIQIMN